MNNFPDYYPENCPPITAKPIAGMFFRFTTRNVPQKRDFLSYYELGNDTSCQAMGLSVFSTLEACEEMKKKIPSLRNKKIAVALLANNHGKFSHTPSTNSQRHFTWWVSVNLDNPCILFSNVG